VHSLYKLQYTILDKTTTELDQNQSKYEREKTAQSTRKHIIEI
jgi:hypothetical protein